MKMFTAVFSGAILMCVLACNKGGSSQSTKPVAQFSISGYEIAAPATITFINISQNATSYLWDFGDGTSSTLSNPTHTYNLNGSYLLKLRVTGASGADSTCKLVAIAAAPASNRSGFSYYMEKCSGTPVGISFKTINPLSTNPVWDLGNGSLALVKDPITQYLLPGNYTIKYSTQISGVRDTVTLIIQLN